MTNNIQTQTENRKEIKNPFLRFWKWYRDDYTQVSIITSMAIMFIYGLTLSIVQGDIKDIAWAFGHLQWNFFKSAFAEVGAGNAILNASLIALIHYTLARVIKIEFTSSNFLVFWMLVAYTFVGVNLIGYIALIIGTFILSKLKNKHIREYFNVISLGTSVTPIVTYLSWGATFNGMQLGWLGLVIGFFFIILVSMILPELGAIFFKTHDGHSLANTGISAGITMTMAWSIMNLIPATASPKGDTTMSYHGALVILAILYSDLSMGFLLFPEDRNFKGLIKILKNNGKWPADFVQTGTMLGAIFNISLLVSFAYTVNGLITLFNDLESGVHLFSANATFLKMNALGTTALLQVYAYGLFGKQILPALYLTIGVLGMHYIFKYGNFDNKHEWSVGTLFGVILLGWLLSPMIKYGWVLTILSGIIHFGIVRLSGNLHGGIFVYNNGFSTLFTVPFITAIARTFNIDKEESKQKRMVKLEKEKNESRD